MLRKKLGIPASAMRGAVLVILLLGVRCSFDPPSAPSWSVKINIPVANEFRSMADIVEENRDFLSVDDSGVVGFFIEEEIERFEIGDKLSIDPEPEVFETKIGDISLKEPEPQSTPEIILGDILPRRIVGSVDENFSIPIPAFEFQIPKDLPLIDNFKLVSIKSGIVRIRIDNNLAVPLVDPNSSPGALTVTLHDDRLGRVIGKVEFRDRIDPGEWAIGSPLDLGGQTLSNDLSVELVGNSPGSEGRPIGMEEGLNSFFVLTVNISELEVTEGEAKIPPQKFSGYEVVALPDDILVTQASIKSGDISLTIVNRIPINAELKLEIADFKDSDDQTLKWEVAVPKGSSASMTIDLGGFRLEPDQPEELQVSWDVVTEDTGENFVRLISEDFASVEVDPGELIFSRVTGILRTQEVEINPSTKEVDFPEGLDNIDLVAAAVELEVNSTVGFPAELDLTITGTNDAGEVVILPISGEIAPGSPDSPVPSYIILDQDNSNIVEFLNLLPTRIDLAGRILVGDGVTEGTVSESDFVFGNIKFSAPLEFILDDTSIETDPKNIGVDDEDARDRILENVKSGAVFLTLTNHLPVGIGVQVNIASDSTEVFTSPHLVIPNDRPIQLSAGKVSNKGIVTESTVSQQVIRLNEDDLNQFANFPLYSGVRIELPGTNGQKVKVLATDFIEVKAHAEIEILIDEDLFGTED